MIYISLDTSCKESYHDASQTHISNGNNLNCGLGTLLMESIKKHTRHKIAHVAESFLGIVPDKIFYILLADIYNTLVYVLKRKIIVHKVYRLMRSNTAIAIFLES